MQIYKLTLTQSYSQSNEASSSKRLKYKPIVKPPGTVMFQTLSTLFPYGSGQSGDSNCPQRALRCTVSDVVLAGKLRKQIHTKATKRVLRKKLFCQTLDQILILYLEMTMKRENRISGCAPTIHVTILNKAFVTINVCLLSKAL